MKYINAYYGLMGMSVTNPTRFCVAIAIAVACGAAYSYTMLTTTE